MGKAVLQGCVLRQDDEHTAERECEPYAEELRASGFSDAQVREVIHEVAV